MGLTANALVVISAMMERSDSRVGRSRISVLAGSFEEVPSPGTGRVVEGEMEVEAILQ